MVKSDERLVTSGVRPREAGAYGMLHFGFALLGSLVSYYISYFYTDIRGYPLGAVSALLLVVRLFDGGIDPFIGYYMDRRQTKFGKYKGYVLYWGVPFCLLHILLFAPSPVKGSAGVLWCFVVYLLWSFAFSMIEGAGLSLMSAMSADQRARQKINTTRVTLSIVAVLVVNYCTLHLVEVLGKGNEERGFFLTMLLFALAAIPLMLLAVPSIKERNITENNGLSLGRVLRNLAGNKAIIALIVGYSLIQVTSYLKASMTIYYLKYYVEQLDLYPIFMSMGILMSLCSQPLILWCAKRVDTVRLICLGCLGGAACLLLMGVVGQNVALLLLLNCLLGISTAFPANLIYIYTAEMADDYARTEKKSYSATIHAILGLASRVGYALGGALTTMLLWITGYEANMEQATPAKAGILVGFVVLPIICYLVAVFIFWYGEQHRMQKKASSGT